MVQLLEKQGIKIVLDDKRCAGQGLESLVFAGELRKPQKKAVAAMISHDTGILHAPTAFGKTVTAIGLISQRAVNTLILTHSKQLLGQWKERIEAFTTGVKVGVMGGGKKQPSGQIDVATYQSLINRQDNTVSELTRQYGQVIIDECHHISAPQFERVLNEVNAKYVVGLTATPHRQDGHQKIMFMLAGPVRHKVKTESGKNFEQTVVVTQRHDAPPPDLVNPESRPHIAAVYRWLAENNERNEAIVRDVAGCISAGRQPLVLTERRGHAEVLAKQLAEKGLAVVTLKGGMGAKESQSVERKLATVQVVVATGKYVGEGFDLPRLDTLFLALPIAWKGLLAQYAGRIHRQANNKKQVTVYDYVDNGLPMLQRMFGKREKGYQAMGYRIIQTGQLLQGELTFGDV